MVSAAFQIQMARIFGSNSKEAKAEIRTPAQWKKTLKNILKELYKYVQANIETDELHLFMIESCFFAAYEGLKDEDFWPSYVEAITRLNLLLIGDYPDHRKRKSGMKKNNHYDLSRLRKQQYSQSLDQKLKVLFAAQSCGFPKLSTPPNKAISLFRKDLGFKVSLREFIKWYKQKYPSDYAALF